MNDSHNLSTDFDLLNETGEAEIAGEEEVGEPLITKIAGFLRFCWLKRVMVLGIVFAGILISLLYAFRLPNMYTSTTTLMPPGNSSPGSEIMNELFQSSSAIELGSEELGLSDADVLFINILQSRNVQDGLISRLDLSRYYKSYNIEEARKSLARATNIKEDRESKVITIGVTAPDPVVAANIARGYVDELNRVVTNNSTSAAHRERIFLEGRVKDTKQQLDELAKQLSQFSTKSGTIDISSQGKSMVDEGLKLQAELIEGRSVLAALRQTYSEDNVRVRAQEARNAELEQQLNKLSGSRAGSGAGNKADGNPYPTVEELPSLGLTYYDLERQLTVEQSLWEALTKEYEVAKVQEAAEIPTVQVLDVAEVPLTKSSPRRMLIVEVGALISLGLACIAVLLNMMWEGMSPEEEPKRLITEAASSALSPRLAFWSLPGLSWVRKHITGAA